MKKSLFVLLLVVGILVADQALKIWVKTSFYYGEMRPILGLSWARLNFVENPGMAFGMQFGGDYGKLILSLFRIGMIGFLIVLIRRFIKDPKTSFGLLFGLACILSGAIGNMVDCAFYGLIFSESTLYHSQIATMFPPTGGYAPFLHGRVVDMFYFPMGQFPDWLPYLGGRTFFEPVFNIADTAISTGVVWILLFQRRYFADTPAPETETTPETPTAETNTENAINEPDTPKRDPSSLN